MSQFPASNDADFWDISGPVDKIWISSDSVAHSFLAGSDLVPKPDIIPDPPHGFRLGTGLYLRSKRSLIGLGIGHKGRAGHISHATARREHEREKQEHASHAVPPPRRARTAASVAGLLA